MENNIIPTTKQVDKAYDAVKMLLFCNAMMIASTELVGCLVDEGKFKRDIKLRVKQLNSTIDEVCRSCNLVFGGDDNNLCDTYCTRAYELFVGADNGVCLTGSEKWYNIIASLSRLIERYNNSLKSTYYFSYAVKLYGMESKLDLLGYNSNKIIDFIIDKIDTQIDIVE